MFKFSRYQYCVARRDDQDRLWLDEREPFRYVEEADNRYHLVRDGDTLWGLAHLFFSGFPRPCGLWWIIAEFQPQPIVDPTIKLVQGSTLVIPSSRVVNTKIFDPQRRSFH